MGIAAIYCRISDDREGREAGVQAQEAVCREYAERAGIEVAEVFVDNDISASSFSSKARPAYARLIHALKATAVTDVIVRETSRLYRRPRELEDLIDLCEKGAVTIHAPLGGKIDLSTGQGRFVARIRVAVDADESARISERLRYKHRVLAEAGEMTSGGYRPFGLTRDGQHVPDEVALIQEVAQLVADGAPLFRVVKDMNARGWRTTAAGRLRKKEHSEEAREVTGEWSSTTLRSLLSRPYLIGLREHRTDGRKKVIGVTEGKWEPILTREVFDAVQGALASNVRHARTRHYELSGLIWCGKCGRVMTGHAMTPSADRKVRRYACESRPARKGCGQSIDAAGVEGFVFEALLANIDAGLEAQADAQSAKVDTGGLSRQRDELDRRRSDLSAAYGAGKVSIDLLVETERRLIEEMAALDAQINAATPRPLGVGGSEELRRLWELASCDERQELLRRAIRRVVISPAVKQGRGSRPKDRVRLDFAFPV